MNKKIFAFVLAGFLLFAIVPCLVSADTSVDGTANIEQTIVSITDFLVTISIGFAIMMYVIGGFFYMTAAGDTKRIESGKNIILYTTIGLVIILLAKGIASVVLGLVKH